ncbi:hypothetical protein JQK87_32245 [Streptomyces sp. G44]|uniref:hypothetical protein n=1 Tax=Streptomyces sp. G44 TaxID=2807632 RepID=UPI001961C6D4|nr:hypothetical protein [Streptomyces sp. G44]MBM7172983.1 hypothetical protein [Streptomyces sp. G44]
MLPVVVHMTPPPPAGGLVSTAASVESMIWAATVPQDCLEHLTVARGDAYLSIVVFVKALDLTHAEEQVDRLMQRTLGQAPPLEGWTVTGCAGADLRRLTQ